MGGRVELLNASVPPTHSRSNNSMLFSVHKSVGSLPRYFKSDLESNQEVNLELNLPPPKYNLYLKNSISDVTFNYCQKTKHSALVDGTDQSVYLKLAFQLIDPIAKQVC